LNNKQEKCGSKWDYGLWVLSGIAMRVGGSDTPMASNWVVSEHTLQTKWDRAVSGHRPQSRNLSGWQTHPGIMNEGKNPWAVSGCTQ